MTFMTALALLGLLVGLVIGIVLWRVEDDFGAGALGFIAVALVDLFFIIPAIMQPFSLRKEQTRQTREREQILYQVEHLDDTKDKVKLNEWILTYNDWVNDINTENETWGWFSWHYSFDMSKHTIINLV